MTTPFRLLPGMVVALLLVGCASTVEVSIDTRPSGALVTIDGAEAGKTPLERIPLTFRSSEDTHRIVASRMGFADQSMIITREMAKADNALRIELKPARKTVTINVEPLPATVSIDGVKVSATPVRTFSREIEMTVDGQNQWVPHRITVERPGWQKAERMIAGADKSFTYDFTLQPLRKSLNLVTTPGGANIYLDDKLLGKSPLTEKDVSFATDAAGQWNYYKLKLVKPGYEPIEQQISWDDGQSDYTFTLKPISKSVTIKTIPAGSVVTIDGKELPRNKDGFSTATLPFAPESDGSAKKYSATVTRKTDNSEWEPATVVIGYDNGQGEYEVTLKEIKTTWVDLLSAQAQRSKTDDSWVIVPVTSRTLARKDTGEGTRTPPQKMTSLPRGTSIDTVAAGLNGQLVFSVLELQNKTELRSFLKMVQTDGTGGVRELTDGKSLDLHPSFTVDGKEIVFSSDRGGKRQNIWKLSAGGEGGFMQLTNNPAHDLWPSIDPVNMLFFQRLIDRRSDPRIYMTEVGKVLQTDAATGTQPRISPDKTKLLVCEMNEKTGKRDLLLYKINGDKIDPQPTNLTRTPDTDEFDACWSPDNQHIAFVSDRAADEDKRHNFDIWILNVNRPDNPVQVTANGSWDDSPAYGPKGDVIYFRSNRGGDWAVWRMDVPADAKK